MSDQDGALRAAFIHDVRGLCKEEVCRERWAAHGIYLFSHYADAAGQAEALGMITSEGCKRVCAAMANSMPCSCSTAIDYITGMECNNNPSSLSLAQVQTP